MTRSRGSTSGCSTCSGCFPGACTFRRSPGCLSGRVDRAGRTRLLALCWTGFLLVFFTFSTTQEYYSMPCYPALALLLGSAMAAGGAWVRRGTRVLAAVAACAAVAVLHSGGGARICLPPAIFRRLWRSIPALYALAGAHGGPDASIVRLSAASAGAGGRSLPDRRAGQPAGVGQRAFLAAAV